MYRINIYKIWWQGKDDLYVGSTKQKLSMRMAKHRSNCKSGIQFNLYEIMRINGYDFEYVLLQSYEVSCKDEQLKHEQHFIDLLHPNLNNRRAHNTPEDRKQYHKQYRDIHEDRIKQYYETHKDGIRAYRKQYGETHKDNIRVKLRQYYEINKNKIIVRQNTKIECDCGTIIRKGGLCKHIRTQKHIKKINLYYLNLLPFQ